MSLDPALAAHAVGSVGDAIVTVDGAGTITSWNHSAELLLGYGREDAVGQMLALIIPDRYRARHVAAFHKAVDSRRLTHGGAVARVKALTKSGGVVVLGLSLRLLRDRAGALAVLRPLGDAVLEFAPAEGS
jgi:PAS domain S-box-containing protein